MWFKAIFRLKITIEKSEVILVGEVINVKDLVFVLKSKVRNLAIKYLSLPLGDPLKFVSARNTIEKKF